MSKSRASIHTQEGWKGQVKRVKRWRKRVLALLKQPFKPGHTADVRDSMYAFFQNCFHLRDWLKNDAALSAVSNLVQNVDWLFDLDRKRPNPQASQCLKLCRDICNGTKHLKLTGNPSVDRNFVLQEATVPVPPVSG